MRGQENRARVGVALVVMVLLTLFVAGSAMQRRWDAQCAASQPGSHWDGDDWLCKGARS